MLTSRFLQLVDVRQGESRFAVVTSKKNPDCTTVQSHLGLAPLEVRSSEVRTDRAARAEGYTLKQNYFIVVLAHSFHGRLQRVHIPYRFIYAGLGVFAFTILMLFSAAGSYARMAWKVANYNSLQHEAQMLRERYDNLQRKVKQTNEQLASLQMLADEVTTAYGVKKQLAGSPDLISEAPGADSLMPSMGEALAEYSYLRTASLSIRHDNIFS